MKWAVGLTVSILLLAITFTIIFGQKRQSKFNKNHINTFVLLIIGVFLSIFVCFLPFYSDIMETRDYSILKIIMLSIHNTFQVFTLDADHSIISEGIDCENSFLASIYSGYISVMFVVAPFLTFSVILSFFKNFISYIRFLLSFNREIYVFSELNEESLCLGNDIKRNHKKATIVYTDVFENNNEESYELCERAKTINSLCFKKDIAKINYRLHSQKTQLSFFIIGSDETENIEQSLNIVEKYKNRKNTRLYLFSTRRESEFLFQKLDSGEVKVRRINEVKSLIYHNLYTCGRQLFETATELTNGVKIISAVIVGLGKHGIEMLKALAWYCQMDGYRLIIHAFDNSSNAKDRLAAICPDLLSDKYNGKMQQGEAEYTINIFDSSDFETKSFADKVSTITNPNYVFVAIGSDEDNIRAAIDLRMQFERNGYQPLIQAVVCNANESKALKGASNFRNQPYKIDLIGDNETRLSEKVIINSELEKQALELHKKRYDEEDFWKYEYNYSSSLASVIHLRARIECQVPGAEKSLSELSENERIKLEIIEHRRWNAYMRSEGYILTEGSRNDLGKMHPNLVSYYDLDEGIRRIDSLVGTRSS